MVLSNYISTIPSAGPLGGAPRRPRSPKPRTTRQQRAVAEREARFGAGSDGSASPELRDDTPADVVTIMSAHMGSYMAPRVIPRHISELEKRYEPNSAPEPEIELVPTAQPTAAHRPAAASDDTKPTRDREHGGLDGLDPQQQTPLGGGFRPTATSLALAAAEGPAQPWRERNPEAYARPPVVDRDFSALVPISPERALQMARLGLRGVIKEPVVGVTGDLAPIKWGEASRALSPRSAGKPLQRRVNPHLQAPIDGVAPGTNWFPLAEELAEQWAKEAQNRQRRSAANAKEVTASKRKTPSQQAAERWAREAAVLAAEIQLKAFNIELRNIRAVDVRDLDDDSTSDPYVVFTLLECSDLGGAHTPSDRTPHLRNARNPVWTSPCTLRIPAGSHAACALARTQIEPSIWRLVSKYLTPELREHAAVEPLLGVELFDFDPDGQKRRENKAFDDTVGSSSVRLGHTSGIVDMLELPSDEQRRQAAKEAAEVRASELEQPTGTSPPASPLASSRSLFSQLLNLGDDSRTRTKISFEYVITEYVPPPPATLTLRSFTVEGELYPEGEGGYSDTTPRSQRSQRASPTTPSKGSRRSRPASPLSPSSSDRRQGCVGPYLRFVLLEANELPPPSGKLPAANADTQAPQPWLDRSLALRLPEGSPRPPLLRVQLYDEATSGAKGVICSTEVRLDGAEGSTLVRLDHTVTRQGRRGRTIERVRQLAIRFAYGTVVNGLDADEGRPHGPRSPSPKRGTSKKGSPAS